MVRETRASLLRGLTRSNLAIQQQRGASQGTNNQTQLAQEQKNLINEQLNQNARAFEEESIKLNQAIDSAGSPARENELKNQLSTLRANFLARKEGLSSALKQATGQFTTESLLRFSQQVQSSQQEKELKQFSDRPFRARITTVPAQQLPGIRVRDNIPQQNKQENFKFLIRNEQGKLVDLNIGGAIRKGSEKFVGKVDKRLNQALGLFQEPIRTINVPERRTFAKGTSGDKSIIGGVSRPQDIKQFSLAKGLLGAKSPISAGDVGIALFFTPAFLSGTAGQSAYVQDQLTGKFLTKAQASKLAQKRLNELLKSGYTKVETPEGTIDLIEITRSLVNRNKNNPANLKKLAEFYKQSGRESLFRDLVEQEISEIPKAIPQKVGTIQRVSARTGETLPPINLQGGGAEAKLLSQPSRFAGTGQFEQTRTTTIGSSKGLVANVRGLQRQNVAPLTLEQIRQTFLQEQQSLQRNLQSQGATQSQISEQVLKLKQNQREKIKQRAKQIQSLAFSQIQQQRQQGRERSRQGRERFRPRPRFRTGGLPLPKPLSSKKMKRIPTEITKTIPKGYDIFVKKRGKIKKIGSVKGTKAQARDFLGFKLDKTLRASGFTRPSKSKKLKPIPLSITGYLSKNAKKFYNNKKGFLVEKPKYRLEKGGSEVKRIQQLRRNKPFAKRIKTMITRK